MAIASDIDAAHKRVSDIVQALGPALASVETYVEPAIARSVQSEQNLYDRIEVEFGLFSAGPAGVSAGSRSQTAARNHAANERRAGRLLALHRGSRTLYPGFQFDPDTPRVRPVIVDLIALAREHDWDDASVVQWLCSPTTYLDGSRPVELVASDPERLTDLARHAWSVEW